MATYKGNNTVDMIKKILLITALTLAIGRCHKTYAGSVTAESIRDAVSQSKTLPVLSDPLYTTLPREETLTYLKACSSKGRQLRYRSHTWDCDDFASLTAAVTRFAYAAANPTAEGNLAVFHVTVILTSGGIHALVMAIPDSGEVFFFEPQNGTTLPPGKISQLLVIHH